MRKKVWLAAVLACLIVLAFGATQGVFAEAAETGYSLLDGEEPSDEYVELIYACDTAYYGDSEIEFRTSFEGVTGEAVIGGKTYTLTYQGYHYNAYYGEFKHEYALTGIPVLPVGTKIEYTLRKGTLEYTGTVTVEKGPPR